MLFGHLYIPMIQGTCGVTSTTSIIGIKRRSTNDNSRLDAIYNFSKTNIIINLNSATL